MDLKTFFDDNNIEYWEHGKNVSAGYINIQCPFCGDTSNHLGIKKTNINKVNCWKCGKHNIIKLIMELINCTYKQSKEIVKSIDSDYEEEKIIYRENKNLIFPIDATKQFPKAHLKYLKDRGFNPKKTIKKFNLFACDFEGEYKFRIIIPIYENNRIVSFTSRDITENAKSKYKNAKPSESIIDPRKLIFNFNNIQSNKDAFLVEGPFDVMKIWDGAFCFMGVEITEEKLKIITDKKIDRLFLFFDNDLAGQKASKRYYRILKPIVGEVVKLKFNRTDIKYDPGKLSFDQINEIKRSVNFNF